MKCKICNFNNAKFIDTLKPYENIDWEFRIFECQNCDTRFTERNKNINYYEKLYSANGGPYSYYYEIAKEVKNLLDTGNLRKCERLLKNSSDKYAMIIDFIVSLKEKNIKILEIGCSTGFLTAFFKARGQDILGIDVSERAIGVARKMFGDFYGFKEQNTQYDVIYHTGLIGCVDNPKDFFNHYLSLLKKNGSMIFNAPNINSPKQLNETWVGTPPPDLIYLFSKKSFNFLIDSEKFNIKIKKTYNYLEIFKKYLNLFKKKPYNKYPTIFCKDSVSSLRNKLNLIKKVIKIFIVKITYILCSIRVFKKFDSEYGLLIQIIKK